MFTRTKFYRHINMNGVFVQVYSLDSVMRDGFYATVVWWNQGCMGRPWIIDLQPQRIFIKSGDLYLWKEIKWDQLVTPRIQGEPK